MKELVLQYKKQEHFDPTVVFVRRLIESHSRNFEAPYYLENVRHLNMLNPYCTLTHSEEIA
jgi:hypothetical protein